MITTDTAKCVQIGAINSMHETSDTSKEILEEIKKHTALIEQIYESSMGAFVQTTRLYDIFVASATEMPTKDIVALLDDHEKGNIHTAGPVIKEFGKGYE